MLRCMAGSPVGADRIARYTALIEAEESTLDELSQRISAGASLSEVCAAWDVPYGRIAAWLTDDASRAERYAAALRLRADLVAAECIPIADNARAHVQRLEQPDGTVKDVLVFPDNARDRLRVETRLKLAAKWDRGRYGGDAEAASPPRALAGPVSLLEVARRLAFTLAQGAQLAREGKREPRLLEGVSVTEPEVAPTGGGDI